jgi:molybdopterin molybdotransferase
MYTFQEALHLILAAAKPFGTETISIHKAFNRILAEEKYADREYPPFNRAAMDGYAVQMADLKGTEIKTLQQIESVFAGQVATKTVISGTCIKIMTGAPVPQGADAVIKIEETHEAEDGTIHFNTEKIKIGQNIAAQGEDCLQGDLLISKNTLLDFTTISLLATIGSATVKVYSLPTITVISTGTEIVPVENPVLSHQIHDSNAFTIKNFLKKFQPGEIKSFLVDDDLMVMKTVLKEELKKDIIILSGGVSKGDADYIPEVMTTLGVKEIFHRVKIKPGSPLWFGQTAQGGVVFGLPGNPVAVAVSCKVFIEPFLRHCMGMPPLVPMYLPLFQNKKKKTGFDEFFPCKLVNKEKKTGLLPMPMNGSGDIKAVSGSHGIAIHPSTEEGLQESELIAFYPW